MRSHLAAGPSLFNAAAAECNPILQSAFGEFELNPEEKAEIRDRQLAEARCIRENGVEDWPDPDVSGFGSTSFEIGDFDLEVLQEALEICSENRSIVSGDDFVFSGDENSTIVTRVPAP